MASTDGFCSLISFKPGELGEIYVEDSENINSENKETAMEVESKPVPEMNIAAKTGEKEKPKSEEVPVNQIMVRKKEKPPKDNKSQSQINDESPNMVVSEIQTMKQTSDITAQPIAIKRK